MNLYRCTNKGMDIATAEFSTFNGYWVTFNKYTEHVSNDEIGGWWWVSPQEAIAAYESEWRLELAGRLQDAARANAGVASAQKALVMIEKLKLEYPQ